MRVYFTSLSQKEYQEAVYYYDDQNIVIGNEFIGEVEEAIKLIVSFPSAWPLVNDKLRRYVLKRFPFMILYKFYGDRVVIFAIAHQHREPTYYLKRHPVS